MDHAGFDRFTRSVAQRLSRRHLVTGGSVAATATMLRVFSPSVAAQGETPVATPVGDERAAPMFLFVQTAVSGSFTPAEPAAGTPAPGDGVGYRLTLEGHPGGTVYFSDRPERIVGDAPTQAFLDGLGFSPFDPPNAALVIDTGEGEQLVLVVELTDPRYDATSGTLIYGATLLAEYQGEGLQHLATQQQDMELPASFGRASLFIDDCPDITQCWLDDLTSVGPIPGGPYGQCWHWSDFACEPCHESQSSLNDLCNQSYSDCTGFSACTAV
jgi:hypothetical protein